MINKYVYGVRSALAAATETIGSKINPLKTEIVMTNKFAAHVKLAKIQFKWLGYSFEINVSNAIHITDKQINAKSTTFNIMFTDLLSYVDSLAMRIKMYKVWAAPVIEFFLLQEAMNNTVKSKLEPLQHQCLTKVCSLSFRGVSMTNTNQAFGELSIELKLFRFAKSLTSFPTVSTLIQQDKNQENLTSSIVTYGPRSYKVNTVYDTKNTITLKLDELTTKYINNLENYSETKKKVLELQDLKTYIKQARQQVANYASTVT